MSISGKKRIWWLWKKQPSYTHRSTNTHIDQTGGDLDCLSAISPEGLLPHSLVFRQRTNGTCNAAQIRHHRICSSFFPPLLLLILTADRADKVFPPQRRMLPHPPSNSIRRGYVRARFDDKFPALHNMSFTHLVIFVDSKGPEEGQSVRSGRPLWLSVWGQRVYFLNYKGMWWAASTTSSVLTERSCCSPTLKTHGAAGGCMRTHYGSVCEPTEELYPECR